MKKLYDQCYRTIINNNLPVDFVKLNSLEKDPHSFFRYIFTSLKWDNLSSFMPTLLDSDQFLPFIKNNFTYLYTHMDKVMANSSILYLINCGVSDEEFLELVREQSNDIVGYKRILRMTKNKLTEFKDRFEKENNLYYSLYEKIDSGIYDKSSFETSIIYPQSYYEAGTYLEYVIKLLEIDPEKLEYMPNRGNFGWCFKYKNFVLKLASQNMVWNIPHFYRINDFIIRKQFDKSIISICPFGDTSSVTNEDISDALIDFDNAGIVLEDKNYAKNFAVVDYEIPDNLFRDVSGIRTNIDIQESDTYKKKKVKLIDQDFLYLKSDNNIDHCNHNSVWK